MSNTKLKPSFWIVNIILLLWSAIGVFQYLVEAYNPNKAIEGLDSDIQAYYANRPSWVVAAFAIAVFFEFGGMILVLLRKKLSYLFFLISLGALIIQLFYNLILQDDMHIELAALILPIFILAISLALPFYAKSLIKRGILN